MTKAALLIGVSEYPSGLHSLPAAIAGVEAIAKIWQNPEMSDFTVVKTLTNPDRHSMELEIKQFFADRNSYDLVVLFFSGWAISDEKKNLYFGTKITTKNQNGNLDRATAVSANLIHEVMENCLAQRQVLILDCCFSTTSDPGGAIRSQLGAEGRIVLTSCSSAEYSLQQGNSNLSIYTRYLVEGIETGVADQNQDSKISIGELHKYAERKVQETAPNVTPQIIPLKGMLSDIFIAKTKPEDPLLKYRKQVENYAINGVISLAGREILAVLTEKFKIEKDVVQRIEEEVLRPYQERLTNLQAYREVFALNIEQKKSISPQVRLELEDLRQTLGLRKEDIKPIEEEMIKNLDLTFLEASIELRSFEFQVVEVDSRGNILKEDIAKADYFREDLGNGIVLEMVKIPSGSFIMGSPETEDAGGAAKTERPEHLVKVSSFFMGMFVITQEQYEQVMGKGKNPSQFKGVKNPVERINWHDAKEFCQELSQITGKKYRLPTEAEWEYACRAGTKTPFYLGATITSELANYKCDCAYASEVTGKSVDKTVAVGTYPPNGFGLYDMCGNVWEWCEDNWKDNYYQAYTDGSAWLNDSNKRLLRGGAWTSYPKQCRSASRYTYEASGRTHCNGFRVVCSID